MISIVGFSEVVMLTPGMPAQKEMRVVYNGNTYGIPVSDEIVQHILNIVTGRTAPVVMRSEATGATGPTGPGPCTVGPLGPPGTSPHPVGPAGEEPYEGEVVADRTAATVGSTESGYPVRRISPAPVRRLPPRPAFVEEDEDGKQI
jgi:hypothetical protein